jgi:hypothetical protein
MLRWKRGHDGANCITSLTETASNWCVIWKVSSLSRAFQYCLVSEVPPSRVPEKCHMKKANLFTH